MPHFLHQIENSSLIVDGNLEVRIEKIKQFYTYQNILEGVPSEEDNEEIVRRAIRSLQTFTGLDHVHAIKPVMIPIPLDIRMRCDRVIETLPKICCMIKVNHDRPYKDLNMDYSALGILWFQSQFAMPIDPIILLRIKEINFKKCLVSLNI